MLLKLATGWESWQEFAPWALKLVLVTSFLVVEFALLAPNAGSLAVTLLLGGSLIAAISYLTIELIRKGLNI